jgi:peptide/nickel transport system permease protein
MTHRPAELRLGFALLGLVAVAVTLGAALWPAAPDATLDPPVAAFAPPGARFETLRLGNGRRLAADSIERRGESYLLHGSGLPDRTIPVSSAASAPRSLHAWLGTDQFGRDVAARLLHGGRLSLAVAGSAVALALGCGVPLGLAAGLARGRRAALLRALLESAQAFPRLFLVVALAAIVPPGRTTTVLLLGLTGWVPAARLVRAESRRLAASDFVLAARAAGAGPLRLAWRHLLPNMAAPIAVEASLAMAGAVAGEAALSFLGLGAPPPTASWGGLIADGRDALAVAPWISLAPGVALALVVLAFNLVAEAGRGRFDPRSVTLPG